MSLAAARPLATKIVAESQKRSASFMLFLASYPAPVLSNQRLCVRQARALQSVSHSEFLHCSAIGFAIFQLRARRRRVCVEHLYGSMIT